MQHPTAPQSPSIPDRNWRRFSTEALVSNCIILVRLAVERTKFKMSEAEIIGAAAFMFHCIKEMGHSHVTALNNTRSLSATNANPLLVLLCENIRAMEANDSIDDSNKSSLESMDISDLYTAIALGNLSKFTEVSIGARE